MGLIEDVDNQIKLEQRPGHSPRRAANEYLSKGNGKRMRK